jgi:hypothetical protein
VGEQNRAGWSCDPQGEVLRNTFLEASDECQVRQRSRRLKAAGSSYRMSPWASSTLPGDGEKNVTGVPNPYIVEYWDFDKKLKTDESAFRALGYCIWH